MSRCSMCEYIEATNTCRPCPVHGWEGEGEDYDSTQLTPEEIAMIEGDEVYGDEVYPEGEDEDE